jgi:hypothetical protein
MRLAALRLYWYVLVDATSLITWRVMARCQFIFVQYLSGQWRLTMTVLRAVSVLRASLPRHNVPRYLSRRFSTPSEGVGSSKPLFETYVIEWNPRWTAKENWALRLSYREWSQDGPVCRVLHAVSVCGCRSRSDSGRGLIFSPNSMFFFFQLPVITTSGTARDSLMLGIWSNPSTHSYLIPSLSFTYWLPKVSGDKRQLDS